MLARISHIGIGILLLPLLSACKSREFTAEFSETGAREQFIERLDSLHIPHRIDNRGRIVCVKPAVEECESVYAEIMRISQSGK